jgi:transposase
MTSTPPRNPPNGHWNTPMRSRVLALLDHGVSKHEISRQTTVPRSTIINWSAERHSRRNKVRSGRPPSLTQRDVRHLISILRKNWEGRRLCWRKLGQQAGLTASGRTIQRALEAEGYTRCKACKKPFIDRPAQKARLAYSIEHLNKPEQWWQQHMYSDESTFDTSRRGSAWVTRLSTERDHNDCIQHTFNSGRASVPVWGAISYNWKSELVFLKPTGKRGITASDYQHQVLEPIVGPAFNNYLTGYSPSSEGLFVEDQAPWHGTKQALVDVKRDLGIPLHKRPPSSPDLNPIENVWRIMKQRIKARAHFPGTYAEMCKAVQEEWDRLKPSDWNPLIDSMVERVKECEKRKGMQTRW